jgi:hypothetical protein
MYDHVYTCTYTEDLGVTARTSVYMVIHQHITTLFTSETKTNSNFEIFIHVTASLFVFNLFNNSFNTVVYITSINIT